EGQKNCLDPASAALLGSVAPGRVAAPVFYGPAVLALSAHEVVAGPYHRAGDAILDAISMMRLPPAEARAVLLRRGVDYVAICATSRETGLARRRAPDGLLAALVG